MPKIFISYRRADSSILATHLAVMLKQYNIDAYVDTRNTDGGGPFPKRLYRAIEDADVFVCLLGSTTLQSEWVHKEIEHAHKSGRVLIPVFQERYIAPDPVPDESIEALLQSDGVHIFDIRNLYIEAAISNLANMILNTPLKAPPSPQLGLRGDLTLVKIEAPKPAIGVSDVSDSIGLTESESVLKTPDLSSYTAAVLKVLPPPFDWCYVPGGEVTLETDPPKTYTIPAFAIAKYTITNAQFDRFVDGTERDGYMYEDQYGWYNFSVEARDYRSSIPKPKTAAFAGDNLPRTNISWYDAVAFTRWLSRRIGQSISLPTEQQWQRAAVGDTGWMYPWGNEFDSSRCNTPGSRIGKPVSVTEYPDGVSPFGVFNMSGNVWEWCLNDYGKPDDVDLKSDVIPVLRGGSFNDYLDYAASSFRNLNSPNHDDDNYGFRLVLSSPMF